MKPEGVLKCSDPIYSRPLFVLLVFLDIYW